LVYLLGTGFTGSTLFAFLANAHSRIASVGEATGPVRRHDRGAYRCSCGATLATCGFWKSVVEAMGRRGMPFGPDAWDLRFDVGFDRFTRQLTVQSLRGSALDAARDALVGRTPGLGRRLREVGERNSAFIDSVLEVTGTSVFLDASKDAARARLLFRYTEPELRIVHFVRDAPGQVSSRLKHNKGELDSSIRYWNRTVGHARRLEALVSPARFLRVRYEDLCTRPTEEMARFVRFVGLEPEPLPSDFRAHEHHIIGNAMRVRGAGEIVLDESWRGRLTPEDQATILRRTASNRRRLGYA
jgi:hypothetical protein